MGDLRARVAAFLIVAVWAGGGLAAEVTHIAVKGGFAAITRATAPIWEVDLRFADKRTVTSARLQFGDKTYPSAGFDAYPGVGDRTSVLFLVDTSDPARQAIVEQNARDIMVLTTGAPAYRRFGLARFDNEMTVIVPLGSQPLDVATAAAKLKANGQITQLYQSTVKALDVLAADAAQRRALVLFTDGLSEDDGYTENHAIKRAQDAGIAIYGYGYTHIFKKKTKFGKLSLMARSTGGGYGEAAGTGALPADALKDPFAKIETGGRINFDLHHARSPFTARRGAGRVLVSTDKGDITIPIDVDIPLLPWQAALRQPEYGGAGAGLVVVALGLVIWGLRRRRHARQAAAPVDEPQPAVHAALHFLDSDGRVFELRTGSIVLGRGASPNYDNDVVLENDTVSDVHAAIRRQRDGSYLIADLDSLNGVFVNDEKVTSGPLADSDICELGEVRFRFAVLSAAGSAAPPETAAVDPAPAADATVNSGGPMRTIISEPGAPEAPEAPEADDKKDAAP